MSCKTLSVTCRRPERFRIDLANAESPPSAGFLASGANLFAVDGAVSPAGLQGNGQRLVGAIAPEPAMFTVKRGHDFAFFADGRAFLIGVVLDAQFLGVAVNIEVGLTCL